jgi:hypothetical protein
MKYQEIEQMAFDLYGASSSHKQDWIDEYKAYLAGDGNTIWNDSECADWTKDEKKECLDIILSLYDKLKEENE